MKDVISSLTKKAKNVFNGMFAEETLGSVEGSCIDIVELEAAIHSGINKQAFLKLVDSKKIKYLRRLYQSILSRMQSC